MKALPMGQSSELIAGTNTSKDEKRLIKEGRKGVVICLKIEFEFGIMVRHAEEDKNQLKIHSQLEFHLSKETPTVIGGLDINTQLRKKSRHNHQTQG